jgi:hypothetical protein
LAPIYPVWSPSPVLQLISEPVWLSVGFNMLYDPNVTWRKVMLSLCSSMTKISVIVKTKSITIS